MRPISLLPELKPFVEVPFADKYVITQIIIERNLRELGKNCAIAFSGGKDSQAVVWMVTRFYPDIPVIFNDTGVEYPETVKFVHDFATKLRLNLIVVKPDITFWECVDRWGFPVGKRPRKGQPSSKKCCYHLKDKPMSFILKCIQATGYFTGVTAVENRTRMFNARDKGTCYVVKGIKKVHPILYWTPSEVRQYLADVGLPVNPVYAKGAERVGCSTCTAFIDWEKQLSVVNPKLYVLVKQRFDFRNVVREAGI